MPDKPATLVSKNQIIRLFIPRLKFQRLQLGTELIGQGNGANPCRTFRRPLVAVDVHTTGDMNKVVLQINVAPANSPLLSGPSSSARCEHQYQTKTFVGRLHQTLNCERIFLHYYPRLPPVERRVMDMVLRGCVEPRFICDTALLDQHIKEVQAEKAQLIADADSVDKSVIMSTPKFKAALEALGVDIEYKDSPTSKNADGTPKQIPAFAKTDAFMAELQEHPDPRVAALTVARADLKSTLEETRSQTLWRIGNLPWYKLPDGNPRPYSGGTMPIPLRFGGAHTHRLSGDWRMNMQNMPTVRGSKGRSKLRLSLKAPPGHTVVTCDLGQIEARLSAWICGANSLIEQFAKYDAGEKSFDPYNRLASEIFGRPVDRKLSGPDEIMGFIGKTGILGLGYGCGKDNFHAMVIRNARAQCMDISQIYSRDIGDKAVEVYRGTFHQLPTGWRTLNHYIANYWLPPGRKQHGPVRSGHDRPRLRAAAKRHET
jgi:hypothetical protein